MRVFVTFMHLVGLLAFVTLAQAAQSTADVSASPELKESARQRILGDRAEQLPREDEYIIGYGDVLSVSIFGEGEMEAASSAGINRGSGTGDAPRVGSSGVQVMLDGRISLKHIGDVEVVGLTLTQLADYLKELYAVIYDEPIVTTTLLQSNSLRYTVMGNVPNPGVFFLDYPLTVVQVVARSGGFTEWASKDIIVVRKDMKEGDDLFFKDNTLVLDYDDFVSGEDVEKNVHIRSGDIIIID